LLGAKKLNGLKLSPVLLGVRITEAINRTTLSAMRIVVSCSALPILRVNALFFSFEEGLLSPQKGQLPAEPEISFLQLGHSSEVLTFEGAIIRLSDLVCQLNRVSAVNLIIFFPKLYLSKRVMVRFKNYWI